MTKDCQTVDECPRRLHTETIWHRFRRANVPARETPARNDDSTRLQVFVVAMVRDGGVSCATSCTSSPGSVGLSSGRTTTIAAALSQLQEYPAPIRTAIVREHLAAVVESPTVQLNPAAAPLTCATQSKPTRREAIGGFRSAGRYTANRRPSSPLRVPGRVRLFCRHDSVDGLP